MKVSGCRQRLVVAALLSMAVLVCGGISASAQQITYYNFNTPATASPSQYSYSCGSANPVPLFCLNYQGTHVDPSFIQDPASSGTYAAQMTYPAQSQASSLWFSVAQKVAGGFNAWFQFKITPTGASGNTADGIVFVIQNAQGGKTDVTGSCSETGSGPTVVGGEGGCIGYGGIDNSVALEFDTYNNGNFGDPGALGATNGNDNHIALQNCGAGKANSPDHNDCQVKLGTTPTLVSNPKSSSTGNTVTLADGNVHDVVVVYNGPLDTPANTIAVYLDPTYNEGTHTPVTGSVPVFQGPFDITQAINLLNSGSANDSAYVGFTSATGAAFETHELMAWTFTPHTTVQQQQPLNPPGTPTTFNFGTHDYSVTYPSNSQTSGITMGVIASTIAPTTFTNLIGLGPTQYTGSACQVYDDTGGNCIIYSVYCYETGSPSDVVACPTPQNPPSDCASNPSETNCIGLTSSYNNSVQPTSPGYLQGDPLYSPVTSITGNGAVATVTCTGECPVTAGQTITILDANDSPEFTGITVGTVVAQNQFTFTSAFTGTDTGGFLTSNNVQDIFQSYTPQNLDGSSTGKTAAYSDFVVTSATTIGSQTQVSAPNNNTATQNQAEEVTATISIPTTGPTGLTLLSEQSIGTLSSGNPVFTQYPGNTVSGTVSFSDNNGAITSCQNVGLTAVTTNNVTTYQAQCNYTPGTTGSDTITAQYSGDSYHQGSSNDVILNVNPQTVQVTVGTSPAGLTYDINNSPFSAGQNATWNVGTNYSLYAPSPQTLASVPNTQYVFSSWSNGVTTTNSATDVITAPATAAVYTANFTPQYLLSATAGPGGSVTVAGGYYSAGMSQPILATANPGYTFSGWTGSADIANASSASTSITIRGPESIMANFTAVPTISVTPPSIDFGTLYLGNIVTKTVTVSNVGAAPMSISDPFIAIVSGGNSYEFITLNLCPKTLAAGKSCIMTVTFLAGPFYTPQTATLTINTNAPGGSQTVPLTATVINPQATFNPSSVNFGTVKSGSTTTKPITLTNTGTTALAINNIAITGATSDFGVASSTCPTSLPAGKSCSIGVTFAPGSKGTWSGALVVSDNASSNSQSVALSGKSN